MTRLVWDKPEDRTYEYGVDHGVFYRNNKPGVVWNGLISVDEGYDGGEKSTYYFDGKKYFNDVASKDFKLTVQAFAPPLGFGPCDGEVAMIPGFILTKQRRETFDFTYRTKVASDGHYKLHLVYNVTASRNSVTYTTKSNTPAPSLYNWAMTSVPVPSTTAQPTAHVVFDSRKTPLAVMLNLELLLYGTYDVDPRMLTQPELSAIKDELDGGDPYSTGYGLVDGGVARRHGFGLVDGGGVP